MVYWRDFSVNLKVTILIAELKAKSQGKVEIVNDFNCIP